MYVYVGIMFNSVLGGKVGICVFYSSVKSISIGSLCSMNCFVVWFVFCVV